MDILLLLSLAVGIGFCFWYAARAAFKADSRQRRDIEKKFADIVKYLKADDEHESHP